MDILVSGTNAEDHLQNLWALFKHLQDLGLHCRLEKCAFAQPSMEYLGQVLLCKGVSKGSKVDSVRKMQSPSDVTSVHSFLCSMQFYRKFIPDCATISEPLTRLAQKGQPRNWYVAEQAAFQRLKSILCT